MGSDQRTALRERSGALPAGGGERQRLDPRYMIVAEPVYALHHHGELAFVWCCGRCEVRGDEVWWGRSGEVRCSFASQWHVMMVLILIRTRPPSAQPNPLRLADVVLQLSKADMRFARSHSVQQCTTHATGLSILHIC